MKFSRCNTSIPVARPKQYNKADLEGQGLGQAPEGIYESPSVPHGHLLVVGKDDRRAVLYVSQTDNIEKANSILVAGPWTLVEGAKLCLEFEGVK